LASVRSFDFISFLSSSITSFPFLFLSVLLLLSPLFLRDSNNLAAAAAAISDQIGGVVVVWSGSSVTVLQRMKWRLLFRPPKWVVRQERDRNSNGPICFRFSAPG
jgi:hypothetical protein